MVQAIPEGVGSVVPYLCVRGAKKAIEFYQAAFGAEVMSIMPMGDDLVGHADLKIGSARVYLADEMPQFGALKSPATLKGTSANIHLWVEDCDASFARAVKAGAKVAMPLMDQFWGDRYGMVSDPFGHAWAISSHKEDLTPEELTRRSEEAMAQMARSAPKSEAKRAAKKAKPAPVSATKPKPAPKANKLGKAATPTEHSGSPAAVAPKKGGSAKTSKAEKKTGNAEDVEPKAAKSKKSKKDKKDQRARDKAQDKKDKKDRKRKKKSKR